jgi:hypothetical protein
VPGNRREFRPRAIGEKERQAIGEERQATRTDPGRKKVDVDVSFCTKRDRWPSGLGSDGPGIPGPCSNPVQVSGPLNYIRI